MRNAIASLALYVVAMAGFSSWFWQARRLTGDVNRDASLKRRLRVIMLVSFLILGAAYFIPPLLR